MNNLQKELIYRSYHRGCKETDILLGDYAIEKVGNMTESEQVEYQQLIAQDDGLIYHWLTGQVDYPANINHILLDNIKQFHAKKNA